MNTSKCFCRLALLMLSLISTTVFGQVEKLGIVQYTPLGGWMKTAKDNVVAFSRVDQTKGVYCIITLYGATAGTGDPERDFARDWEKLVATTFKNSDKPSAEKTNSEGWTILAGGSAVEGELGKAIAFLTVISGFGTTVSVLAIFNEAAYATQVDEFIKGINIDKPSAATKAPVAGRQDANLNNSPGKFGLMRYIAPAGWTEQKFGDGVVFKPADLPSGEHLAVQIMPPLNATGTLEQAFEQSYQEATAMYKATKMYPSYGKVEPHRSFNGWEYVRARAGIKVDDGTQFGTEVGLEMFVVKVNNRFERVAILESRPSCKPNYSRYYTTDRISYRNAIETLLYSLQFDDFKEAPLSSGSPQGVGIVGVWQGMTQSTSAARLQLEAYSLILLDNGQVYYGPHFPTEGFDGLNTRIPPELNRRDWKTYTFANGRGNLKMIYADIPFRTQGDKLIVTKNQTDWPFFKLNSVDGATFSGTYTLSEVNGVIPAITFAADGRFTDNGALKVLHHDPHDCVNPAASPGSGTYRVKDHTITFTYSDGRKIKLAFVGTDYTKSNPGPPILRMSYDENKLTRQ